MSDKHALQYLSDTIFLNRLYNSEIKKQAGLFESLGFDNIASKIASEANSLTSKAESHSEAIEMIKEFIISGTLFRIHPLLGIANTVAETVLGIDLIDIAKQVFQKLTSGSLSLASIDNIFNTESLQKLAWGASPDIPFLPSGNTISERLFGNLLKFAKFGKLRQLLFGIVIWAVKTALLGAGLIEGGKLIKNLLKPKSEPSSETEALKEGPEKVKIETKTKFLKPSGQGTKTFQNNSENLWMVPIINNNLVSTILAWTEEIYPELKDHEDEIRHHPAFNALLSKLSENYHEGMAEMVMPIEFHSRKQVVDSFAQQAAASLEENK